MTSDTPRPKSLRAQHFMFAGVFRAWREAREPEPPSEADSPDDPPAGAARDGDAEPDSDTDAHSETSERPRR